MTDRNTLEDKLKQKLANGEIDQEEFDSMMKKFADLDLLSSRVESGSRKNYSFSGSKTIEGGEISQPIRVSGKLNSTGSISCPSISVSGSATIQGALTVVGPSKISGSLRIQDDAKFGSYFKLSGMTEIGGSAYFTDDLKVSGKLLVEEKLVTGSDMKISGRLDADSINSEARIKLSGKVTVANNIIAEEFITSGGRSLVEGSIRATTVEIAKKNRPKIEQQKEIEDEFNREFGDDEEFGSLGSFIANMVTSFVPKVLNSTLGVNRVPGIFTIKQNIEADQIDISYTHVGGDVIGNDIIIGPDVVIEGRIKYRNSINVPEDSSYKIEKIDE